MKPGSFLAPDPETTEIKVGKVVLLLEERPLEILERAFVSALDDSLRSQIEAVDSAHNDESAKQKLTTIFEIVKTTALSGKLAAVASVLLDTPENRQRISAANGVELDQVQVLDAVKAATARQMATLADAVTYIIGIEDLSKSLRSAMLRVIPGKPKSPIETSASV